MVHSFAHPPSPGDPSIFGTIDLHGLRKNEAIGCLTAFLAERARQRRTRGCTRPAWVVIITGTGSHSLFGPILRTAVINLLSKRGMTYAVNRGGGSLTVDAVSGCELRDDPRTRYVDTKVLVESHLPGSLKSMPDLVNPNMRAGAGMGIHAGTLQAPRSHTFTLDFGPAPLPSEVAASDALLRQTRQSQQKNKRRDEERQRDISLLKDNEIGKKEEEEQRELERVLTLSMEEVGGASNSNTKKDMEEEEDLEKAIQESLDMAAEVVENDGRNRYQESDTEEEEDLEKAIQESLVMAAGGMENDGRNRDWKEEGEETRAIKDGLTLLMVRKRRIVTSEITHGGGSPGSKVEARAEDEGFISEEEDGVYWGWERERREKEVRI